MDERAPNPRPARRFRVVVLDIDGTLLDPSDVVRPTVHQAILSCRMLGVEVALATGRRLRTTLPIVEQLGLPLPLVLYNGALVWDTAHEASLVERPLARRDLERTLEEAEREGLGALVLRGPASGERLVLVGAPLAQLPEFERQLLPRSGEVDRLPAADVVHLDDVLTVDLFGPERELRRATARLARAGLPIYHHGPFEWLPELPRWVANVHAPGVSKASGVDFLVRRLGLELADVLAVGDGENDLPLLRRAGLGVAMGNAPEHVRAQAGAVVRGHDEDGVVEALERFVLEPWRQASALA
ncbi:MAG: HAD family hydrolase [Thermomicrobium sp.]|nr:Cof-type HAD-IIB family hydrolase [Thermomicrobium sp.]MDW8060118.1 HAD family hydrolase [Thermomicrobium sp.]